MANNYTFPGNVNTYVPTLTEGLIIEYSRNPDSFPIAQYIDYRPVDKMKGYYVRMKNDQQNRFINSQDAIWPDGNPAPDLLYGNDPFEFPQYSCTRRAYTKKIGYLSVEQGSWDVLDQAARLLAMDAMTFRSRRVHTTITTTGNYTAGNNLAAVATGGATWANATSTTPSIRKTLMAAAIQIQLNTLGSVKLKDLCVVINPNNAKVIATSQEFIDFLKQSPTSLAVWMGTEQFVKYNIPPELFGLNVTVDDTVYQNSQPSLTNTPTEVFSFPDNVAVVMTKKRAIAPAAGPAFSSYNAFVHEDLSTFVFNNPKDRLYDLQVVENVDTETYFAPESACYIATNS